MSVLASLAGALHRVNDAPSRHAVEDAFRAVIRVPDGERSNVKLFVTMATRLAAAQAKRGKDGYVEPRTERGEARSERGRVSRTGGEARGLGLSYLARRGPLAIPARPDPLSLPTPARSPALVKARSPALAHPGPITCPCQGPITCPVQGPIPVPLPRPSQGPVLNPALRATVSRTGCRPTRTMDARRRCCGRCW